MRYPKYVRELLSRPDVRAWIERGRPAVDRVCRRLDPLARRVSSRHAFLAVAVLAAVVLGVGADVVLGSPGAREIRTLANMPVATVVLDRDDRPAFTIFEERRYDVPLERMSPHLLQAVIAIEDQRFYRHRGLDLWRIAGSAWANLRSTSLEQGASTITQQLAKLSFLTPDKTLRRKLKEAYLAMRIELAFGKNEILETYLNKVYFGNGFYGVEAAARGYFGKPAADLSLPEAALIAGLIQRPSAYAPDRYLDRAVARRALVLESMADAGMIDRTSARAAARTPVRLTDGYEHEQSGAYFKQAVTRELVARFGWETVSRGGLRVYTTYDPAAQRAAEKALRDGLDAIEHRKSFKHTPRSAAAGHDRADSPDYLQGALVALDPESGAVRVLIGGREFGESQFDRATQAHRQSGSAFKPFVYAAALERGYSPATLVTDLDSPIPTPEGPWLPDDGHAAETNAMTIRAALRVSSNRAAAHLLQTVGVSTAADYAKRLGLDVPSVPSMVLGTGDVTLMSLTTAYGAFANGGRLQRPMMIRRVEGPDGHVWLTNTPESRNVISPQTAFQISTMLADVVDRGTAWQARQGGFRLPAAGKTGTTNEYRDAWFVGYTPELVAGVWVGFDRPRTIVPGGYASELAVPIWGEFMRQASAGMKPTAFTRPAGLVAVDVCEESGLLAGPACRRVRRVRDGETREVSTVVTEYFRRGTEPTESCPLHDDSWMRGLRASAFDPSAMPAASAVAALAAAPSVRAVERAEPRADGRSEAGAPPQETGKKKGFWSRLRGVFTGGGEKKSSEKR